MHWILQIILIKLEIELMRLWKIIFENCAWNFRKPLKSEFKISLKSKILQILIYRVQGADSPKIMILHIDVRSALLSIRKSQISEPLIHWILHFLQELEDNKKFAILKYISTSHHFFFFTIYNRLISCVSLLQCPLFTIPT